MKSQPFPPRIATYQFLGIKDLMEWDELASLAHRLTQHGAVPTTLTPDSAAPSAVAEFNTAWNVTTPADLTTLPEPAPFREALEGLAMREVSEPEVFRHFFG